MNEIVIKSKTKPELVNCPFAAEVSVTSSAEGHVMTITPKAKLAGTIFEKCITLKQALENAK